MARGKDALHVLNKICVDSSHPLKGDINRAVHVLQELALNEGLSEPDLHNAVQLLISNKLASSAQLELLNCLIPETVVATSSLYEILTWFFCGIEGQAIANDVQKKCLQWFLGITYYELADLSVIDLFYYSFVFLINQPHLEDLVCSLLCLILKPEDAKRWIIQQVLQMQNHGELKKNTNTLLSLLKSFRPDIVPENVPFSSFCYKTSSFTESLKKAHSRKLESFSRNSSIDFRFHFSKFLNNKYTNLAPLIPTPEGRVLEKGIKSNQCSIMEITSVPSLGVKPFQIERPAQSLAYLRSKLGYHLLAFSDEKTKIRFSHKLYHILWRVFLLNLECYPEKEKIDFLISLERFHEYIQQSIPVVTEFLFTYLLVWDGEIYQDQILKLVQWVQPRSQKDLEKCVFAPLRQIFISLGAPSKCLIIQTLANLMRNLLIMNKKEINFFPNKFLELNTVKAIEAIGNFVNELMSIGLVWNDEEETRNVLLSSIDFYETAQAVVETGDLPLMMLMPPILVYECLFSGSVTLIARISCLLTSLFKVSVERLYALGVFEDFSDSVQILKIYIADAYRCLWGTCDSYKDYGSFIFNENIFLGKSSKLEDTFGPITRQVFHLKYFSIFWNSNIRGLSEIKKLAQDFPTVVMLKDIAEHQVTQ